MVRRIASRAGQSLLVIFGVVTITFILQFVLPGDPARSLFPRTPPTDLGRIRDALGLNDPLPAQYVRYVTSLARGDLGTSYSGRPVSILIAQRLPATALLAVAAVVISVVLGATMGFAAARWRRAAPFVAGFSTIIFATPTFTLGFLLLLLFGYTLAILPVSGFGPVELILPALTLGLSGAPWYSQVVREETEQSLASSYVRTAIAKGIPDRRIIRTHTIRNVVPPVITMAGLDLAYLLSGVAIIESVFGWPGIGNLAVRALQSQDRPVVLGVVLVGATAVVVLNLIVDIVQMSVDPRTRYSRP